MSNQPSTMTSIRSAASAAAQSLAQSLDPSEATKVPTERSTASDGNEIAKKHGKSDDATKDGKFREQLHIAAAEGSGHHVEKEETLYEKATACLPAIPGLSSSSSTDSDVTVDDEDTPRRPDHDVQIEEFLKHQYKSRSE